jgi:hypothetical protein
MLSSTDPIAASAPRFRIALRGGRSGVPATDVEIGVPWLAGAMTEDLFENVVPIKSEHGVQLFRAGRLLLGHAREPFISHELALRTESAYRRILAATRGWHLYRIWNYVPQINISTAGLEHYRAFCQGRSFAFEALLGGAFEPRLPSASAVGSHGNQLEAIFVAGETEPTHFENPEQVPAYHYPIEHGPRAPSFARATVARDGQRTWTFISGTSAIKGHQTIAEGSFAAQVECTLHNLRLIAATSGLGEDLGAGRMLRRQFKVYLRHPTDLAVARSELERSLLRTGDVVTYLQCDICRAALNIEIEATIVS